jgi:hypothetical protein
MHRPIPVLRIGPSILLNDLVFGHDLPADEGPTLGLSVNMGIVAGL